MSSGNGLRFEVAGAAPFTIRNREFGNTRLRELGQQQGVTNGDQVYAYDVALKRTVFSATLLNVTEADRARFEAWVEDTAKGVHNFFTLRVPQLNPANQPDGELEITNARLTSPSVAASEEHEGVWSLEFGFYTVEEGATGPPV